MCLKDPERKDEQRKFSYYDWLIQFLFYQTSFQVKTVVWHKENIYIIKYIFQMQEELCKYRSSDALIVLMLIFIKT